MLVQAAGRHSAYALAACSAVVSLSFSAAYTRVLRLAVHGILDYCTVLQMLIDIYRFTASAHASLNSLLLRRMHLYVVNAVCTCCNHRTLQRTTNNYCLSNDLAERSCGPFVRTHVHEQTDAGDSA